MLTRFALLLGLSLGLWALHGGTAHAQLRLGVEVGGGGEWGNPRGPSIGAFGQLGAQLSPMFAIFYQPSLIIHAMGREEDADLFVSWGNLAMADLTFGMLQLGAGGGVDVGHFEYCSNQTCTTGSRLVQPAVGGRVAVVFTLKSAGPMRARLGIPLAFHVHTSFLEDDRRLTAMLLTIGVQKF